MPPHWFVSHSVCTFYTIPTRGKPMCNRWVVHVIPYICTPYLFTPLSSTADRFCPPQQGIYTSFMRQCKTRSTHDQSVIRSLHTWLSTKSLISQLLKKIIQYNICEVNFVQKSHLTGCVVSFIVSSCSPALFPIVHFLPFGLSGAVYEANRVYELRTSTIIWATALFPDTTRFGQRWCQ